MFLLNLLHLLFLCSARYKIHGILIKNQKENSVIYTELATIPKFHRTAGANQACSKRRSLQADR